MGVRIGCGLSRHPDALIGACEAADGALEGLDGRRADLVLVFASGAHLHEPRVTLDSVHKSLAPTALAGCGAGGVLGGGEEVEEGTAVVVWAASLGQGSAVVEAVGDDEPDVGDASALILIADPYSFSADVALEGLDAVAPGVPIVGGLSSARTLDGTAVLFCGDEIVSEGAVLVQLFGVEVIPCVSQGAAPLGQALTVTAADGHVIHELEGLPALQALRDVVVNLDDEDRHRVESGLLLGIALDNGTPDMPVEDYLVRGVLGADPEAGSIAVGGEVAAGQRVRIHARDAGSADRDLREALSLRRAALGGQPPAGAIMFTCNGRGRDMFGVDHHDAGALAEEFAGAPVGGFFAAGEIGPVAGHPFLHGFTATIGVFAP